MIGLDSNILIQLAIRNHERNSATRQSLNSYLEEGEVFGFPSSVVTEFLHVVTDERRFTPPLTMIQAADWMEELLSDPRFHLLRSTPESAHLTLAWMKRFSLGRKRILDTHLAAILHVNGIQRLLSSNPDDFAVFGVFALFTP
jgi:predicted nucleic acid-binding protein